MIDVCDVDLGLYPVRHQLDVIVVQSSLVFLAPPREACVAACVLICFQDRFLDVWFFFAHHQSPSSA